MGAVPGSLWRAPRALPEQEVGRLPPLLCGVYPADQWLPGCKLLLRRRNGDRGVERPQQSLAGVVGVRPSSFLLLHPEGA